MLLKRDLGRVLEEKQLRAAASNHINGLHESLHALPHVGDGHLELVAKLGRQRHLVIAEHFADLGLARWMLTQVHLLHVALVGVRVTQEREQLTDLDCFRPHVQLFGDFVEKLGVLVDHLYNVVKVVGQLSHVDTKLHKGVRIVSTELIGRQM